MKAICDRIKATRDHLNLVLRTVESDPRSDSSDAQSLKSRLEDSESDLRSHSCDRARCNARSDRMTAHPRPASGHRHRELARSAMDRHRNGLWAPPAITPAVVAGPEVAFVLPGSGSCDDRPRPLRDRCRMVRPFPRRHGSPRLRVASVSPASLFRRRL